jgi:hypothetical protein
MLDDGTTARRNEALKRTRPLPAPTMEPLIFRHESPRTQRISAGCAVLGF